MTAVETEIVAVTVYTDQALVTRRGAVTLTGLERELIVTKLPDTLDTESVRVSGTGRVAVRLSQVSVERVFSSEPATTRLVQLKGQIQQIETERRFLQAQINALDLQSKFLEGLREKTEEPFAQSLSRKNLSPSETLDFLNFLGSQYAEYAIAIGDYKVQQQELDKQLEILRQQVQQIQTSHGKENFCLTVAVEPEGAGDFELEVSYVVLNASWVPLYDLAVSTNSHSLNLNYLAEVTQSTGEDWIGVALTLSTAKPGLRTLPPKPEPWFIDVPSPRENLLRAKAMHRLTPGVAMTQSSYEENHNIDTERSPENFIEAESVVAEISREGSAVNFKLNSNTHIPSDGAPHKTTIFKDDYPCQFEYVAAPRLVSFAYLQANVKNSTNGATLLAGKANIFRDNTFVGTTRLENTAPGQEFKLNLGIDESLNIERDLVERQVDKKLIGNNRRITYGYRIIITNLLDRETSLKLTEQLPVSRNEQVKVRLTRSNPQIQPSEMGILEWALTLSAQAKREIYYQFIVEHPPELSVQGLGI
ncbi:mucoidy inhibitor MuiA family protein [Scytonema sp. UIC 10036]|uniref:mucoidy inhibitor MuiA family protein n=1 Tax=Scytonema sp. UIC 10036 TaxID=2304196 RepID=UPI0012DAA5AD|nr:mucoidy inhibitor MuiA family protein [Scytonema sp. UIC 10036]MUG94743.1 mucoidy inhibitor MuiA family protein [Scytonema sp. UIC 10036]